MSLNLHGAAKPTIVTTMRQHSNSHTYNAHGKDLNAQEYKPNWMEKLFVWLRLLFHSVEPNMIICITKTVRV